MAVVWWLEIGLLSSLVHILLTSAANERCGDKLPVETNRVPNITCTPNECASTR